MIATAGLVACVASDEVKLRPRKIGIPMVREIIRADAVVARTEGEPFRGSPRLVIFTHVHAGALHRTSERNHPKRGRRRDADVLHTGQRGEPIAERAIKLLRALRFESSEARVDFEDEIVIDAQSGIHPGRFVRAADEERRSREKRERESDLYHDEWIARQKTPAPPHDVIAGVLFQIADDAIARQLQRRAERERDCA